MNNRKIAFLAIFVLILIFTYPHYNTKNNAGYQEESERELIPLGFFVSNQDDVNHTIHIDIFDSDKKQVFSQTYDLEPHNYTDELNISNHGGTYSFEATLDSRVTQTYKFTMGYYEGPVDITISNETDQRTFINYGYQIE